MTLRPARLYLIGFIFPLIPPTRLFGLKRALLRWCGAQVGENVRVSSSARFLSNGPLRVGDGTWIGHQVLITGGDAPVVIGANVDIAPRTLIVTGTHLPEPGTRKAAGAGVSLPVHIEDGAWIGAGATILGGAVVGASSIVAASALVRGKLAPGGVFGGVPARALDKENVGA